jgi:hypothetical protein
MPRPKSMRKRVLFENVQLQFACARAFCLSGERLEHLRAKAGAPGVWVEEHQPDVPNTGLGIVSKRVEHSHERSAARWGDTEQELVAGILSFFGPGIEDAERFGRSGFATERHAEIISAALEQRLQLAGCDVGERFRIEARSVQVRSRRRYP